MFRKSLENKGRSARKQSYHVLLPLSYSLIWPICSEKAAGFKHGIEAEHAPGSQRNAWVKKINKDPLFSHPTLESHKLSAAHKTSQLQSVYEFKSQNSSVESAVVSRCLIWKPGLLSHSLAACGSNAAPWHILSKESRVTLYMGSRDKIKDLLRETCKQLSWDKSYLLAFKLGKNSEEEVPAGLNSFQLWARWLYTKDRSKERWWGLQTQQEAFA